MFPSQDVLATGGLGNLIAGPLQGRCRRRGATVFLDLATLEPHTVTSTLRQHGEDDITPVLARIR